MLLLLAASALIGAWLTWSIRARISRYEVSDSARLEVNSAAYPLQTRIAGRVVSARLELGQQIRAGDILVELESESERLGLQEERTRLGALAPQLQALNAQIGVQDQGRVKERRVLDVGIEESRARYREAETRARLADLDLARYKRLLAEGITAEAEYQRVEAEAHSKRAAAENLKIAVSKLEPELQVRESDRESRLKQLQGDITRVNAQSASSTAAIKRLEYEIERRRIRAPISGRLADCAVLRTGSWVTEGEKLGLILPSGDLRVVSEFPPSSALGRLRPGQPATLRLQGFPWAQYGTISAKVSRVADEVRDGKVRVEMAVDANPHSPIPFQHDLPGSVEVEVERVSPAALVLRAAGRMLAVH